jgi:hypothetical protein
MGDVVVEKVNNSKHALCLPIESCKTAATLMNIGLAADDEPTDFGETVGLEATRRGADGAEPMRLSNPHTPGATLPAV